MHWQPVNRLEVLPESLASSLKSSLKIHWQPGFWQQTHVKIPSSFNHCNHPEFSIIHGEVGTAIPVNHHRERFERHYIPQVSRKAHLMHIFVVGGSYIPYKNGHIEYI